MSNPNPKTNHLKPYQVQAGKVLLADKPLTIRVSIDVDTAIRNLPNRSEWMRRVLTEAAERELLLKDKYKT